MRFSRCSRNIQCPRLSPRNSFLILFHNHHTCVVSGLNSNKHFAVNTSSVCRKPSPDFIAFIALSPSIHDSFGFTGFKSCKDVALCWFSLPQFLPTKVYQVIVESRTKPTCFHSGSVNFVHGNERFLRSFHGQIMIEKNLYEKIIDALKIKSAPVCPGVLLLSRARVNQGIGAHHGNVQQRIGRHRFKLREIDENL